MNFELAKKTVGSPKFDTRLIVSNQSTNDIINELLIADNLYAEQYKKIARSFDSENNVEVGKNIFDFLKKNIKYKIEGFKNQTTKSPAYLFYTGKGDCKNYSNFAAGIFKQLGIPYKYRFASYSFTDKNPTHVYIVFYDNSGNERVLDAVLNEYLKEAIYTNKIDKKPLKNMALYRMSGVPNVMGTTDTIGKGKLKKALKKAGAGIKKVAKKAGAGIKKAAVKVKGKVVTYAAAPARGAFLTIVALNAFKARDKIAAAIKKNPDKVHKFWKGFGGDFTKLKKAAKVSGVADPAIGAALATLAATATPIIIAFRAMLKEVGVSDIEGAENVGADVATVTNGEGETTDAETGETYQTRPAGAPRPNPAGNASKKNNTILYVGLGAAALYFITKKK